VAIVPAWRNVFDYLKNAEKSGEEFDMIILTRPASRRASRPHDALRGYKEIHLRSMKMLEPGGMLPPSVAPTT